MNNTREIMTSTGLMFDFYKPNPDRICIEDIAHHLAIINRFTGATRVPYSVAEHCVRASYLPVGEPLLNLMHDSAEAYVGDISSPQKKGLCWQFNFGGFEIQFKQVEAEILRKVGEALGIRELECWLTTPKEVKKADLIMLATEVRDLMPGAIDNPIWEQWIKGIEPSPGKIVPWGWEKAKKEFLRRYEELTNGKSQTIGSNERQDTRGNTQRKNERASS